MCQPPRFPTAGCWREGDADAEAGVRCRPVVHEPELTVTSGEAAVCRGVAELVSVVAPEDPILIRGATVTRAIKIVEDGLVGLVGNVGVKKCGCDVLNVNRAGPTGFVLLEVDVLGLAGTEAAVGVRVVAVGVVVFTGSSDLLVEATMGRVADRLPVPTITRARWYVRSVEH